MATPKKKNKGWDQEVMLAAMKACAEEGLTVYEASKRFGVPRTTLFRRVKARVDPLCSAGRPTSLSKEEEMALVHYIKYMHKIRFPVDRTQIINIAWAIDLRRNDETRVFKQSGPSLKWWRGFKKRHPELSLRKTELIDRGRYDNATEDVINEYFDVLEETLGNSDLTNKPHMVFNCDEASLALNKSSRKVLVPRNSKHCHTIATASSQHVSILCCASAAGQIIPPLIVFSKGMPSGRSFQNEGPVKASYSHSDSGFVDRNMYVEWFTKVFVKHIPSERPAILLQDGATIHISPELIDAAIANNVILLCFPPH